MAKLTIQERIYNFLERNWLKNYTNKEIANYLKININSTRRELGDLINLGHVVALKPTSAKKTYYHVA